MMNSPFCHGLDMPKLSAHDQLNHDLQQAIVRGDPHAVIALLEAPDAQALVQQSGDATPFLPGLQLRQTLQLLNAVRDVGPWAEQGLARLVPRLNPHTSGQTPLMRAIGGFDDLTPSDVRDGMAATLLPLLLPSQDVHAVDDEGLTALERAARVHHQGAFDALLPLTDLARLPRGALGLFQEAVQYGSLAMVQRLLPAVGDAVNAQNQDGNTVLHLALMREDKLGEREAIVDLVLPLLTRHTCWAMNQRGQTPLARAVHLNDLPMVERLVPTFVLHPYRTPMEMLHPAEAAVNGLQWDIAEAIVKALPEVIASRAILSWRQGQKLTYPEVPAWQARIERHWEAEQLRQTLANAEKVDPAQVPSERSRARL